MSESNTLYIPANIKTRTEFFDGFGIPELITTLAVTIIATIICVAIHAAFAVETTALVFIVLVSMAATVTLTVKTESNISMVDQIGFLTAFAKVQKHYPYCYREDWT